MQAAINGSRTDSLLFTNIVSSDPFVSDADTEYNKKREEEQKKLLKEIERRTMEGAYNV